MIEKPGFPRRVLLSKDIGGNDMDIGMFIKKCFEIGIALLNKEKLTEEEKELLNALDSLEKWIQDRILIANKC